MKKLMVSAMAVLTFLMTSNAYAGYIPADGYVGAQIAPNFRSTDGAVGVSLDDENITFTLPFAFTFFGHEYTQGWISGNGLLGFDLGNIDGPDPDNADREGDAYCCDATYIKNAPTNTIVAGWFDLYGDVYVQTSGQIGAREFTVTWNGKEFGSDASNRFQVILREFSTDIEFQYAQLNADQNPADPVHYATAGGIKGGEDSVGLAFIDFQEEAHLGKTGLLIRYDPQAASEVPAPGSVVLTGLGLAALALLRRKTRRARLL